MYPMKINLESEEDIIFADVSFNKDTPWGCRFRELCFFMLQHRVLRANIWLHQIFCYCNISTLWSVYFLQLQSVVKSVCTWPLLKLKDQIRNDFEFPFDDKDSLEKPFLVEKNKVGRHQKFKLLKYISLSFVTSGLFYKKISILIVPLVYQVSAPLARKKNVYSKLFST